MHFIWHFQKEKKNRSGCLCSSVYTLRFLKVAENLLKVHYAYSQRLENFSAQSWQQSLLEPARQGQGELIGKRASE